MESVGLSAFSDKPGLEIEAELEFLQLSYLPVEIMFEGSSKLLTEISFEMHWFGISRLDFSIFSDFSKQEVGTSRFEFKRNFSTFLYFSEEKSNLELKTELELKLLATAQFS